MNIDVGFGCLVAVVVTAGVTGAPEQQLTVENQIANFDEDHLELRGSGCGTKRACMIAGGKCQPRQEKCDGDLRTGVFYCKHPKDCGCCIPPGCVYDGKAYPNGSNFWEGCIEFHCNKGNLTADFNECSLNCRSCPTPCECQFVFGRGCILGLPTIPNHACRCKLDGPKINPDTTCSGTVEKCADPLSPFCRKSGISFEFCMQGVQVPQGDCCGYEEANC